MVEQHEEQEPFSLEALQDKKDRLLQELGALFKAEAAILEELGIVGAQLKRLWGVVSKSTRRMKSNIAAAPKVRADRNAFAKLKSNSSPALQEKFTTWMEGRKPKIGMVALNHFAEYLLRKKNISRLEDVLSIENVEHDFLAYLNKKGGSVAHAAIEYTQIVRKLLQKLRDQEETEEDEKYPLHRSGPRSLTYNDILNKSAPYFRERFDNAFDPDVRHSVMRAALNYIARTLSDMSIQSLEEIPEVGTVKRAVLDRLEQSNVLEISKKYYLRHIEKFFAEVIQDPRRQKILEVFLASAKQHCNDAEAMRKAKQATVEILQKGWGATIQEVMQVVTQEGYVTPEELALFDLSTGVKFERGPASNRTAPDIRFSDAAPANEYACRPPPSLVAQFAYPDMDSMDQRRFNDIELNASAELSGTRALPTYMQANALSDLLLWLEQEVHQGLVLNSDFFRQDRRTMSFQSRFGSRQPAIRKRLRSLDVLLSTGQIGFTETFLVTFNNPRERTFLLDWAKEYRIYRQAFELSAKKGPKAKENIM